MRNVLLLFNPHAGKGKINAKLSAITDILTKEGFLVTAYPTQDKGDARDKILQWGSSYDRIIVAGGDGMLHEAINGVMNLETRIDIWRQGLTSAISRREQSMTLPTQQRSPRPSRRRQRSPQVRPGRQLTSAGSGTSTSPMSLHSGQ